MTDLTPIPALGGDTPRVETFAGLRIAENADLALASLALRAGQTAPAPFGLTLPETSGWTSQDGVAAFWIAPGQWMIEADGKGTEDFAASLKAEAPGCAITEQTDGWVAFEITADHPVALDAMMQKLVNIDPKRLSCGMAVRTGLEHMSVYLIRRSDTCLAVVGMRSFADSLWHALATAAARIASQA